MRKTYKLRGNVVSWPKQHGPITALFARFLDWLDGQAIERKTLLLESVDKLGHPMYDNNVEVIRIGSGLSERILGRKS